MTSIQQKHIINAEQTFADVLETIKKKNADYAHPEDPWSNFRVAAIAGGTSVNQVFLMMYGTKIARLENLLNSERPPSNESVVDSIRDLIGYAANHKSYLELGNEFDADYAFSPEPPAEEPTEVEPEPPATRLLKAIGLK